MITAPADKRTVFGWVLFDFANSAYTTLVVTFIYGTYFVSAIAPDEVAGTALWSRGITMTALCVAFLSPVLGALADQGGLRKRFLFLSTVVAVAGTAALFWVSPGQVFWALFFFVISNIAFEFSNVFYNAYLPDISTRNNIGRISGVGWGVGYIGGLAAMVVALVGFISPETPWFGLSTTDGVNIRATCLLVAAWFALFSIPLFLWVPGTVPLVRADKARIAKSGLADLADTFREIRKYRQIVRLLVARMIYNDGLVTIFAFGGIYAAGTFGFSFQEIMIFGIVLNVSAGIGALIMGIFDDRLGGKPTIQISNCILALAALMAVLAPDKTWFWAAGILVGFFAGPNQSASRSLLGRFVPEEKENQFYGFFAFSGKLTAFMGPLLLGFLTQVFASQRAGVSVVVLFFVIGGLLLTRVDEKKGIAAARQQR
ncbi:MAG: MFS transporter [Desulfotignum sp.]|jgi:UMF1 family MFS transporter|nr:MFS transporter [Desulfotignum sp.]